MNRFIVDLRYAVRRLFAHLGFALGVILTLALGTGAACLYFNVVDAVLLRSVPYSDAQRLVYIWETDAHNATSRESVSWPDLRDWRQQAKSFDSLAGYTRQSLSLTETGSEPERIVAFAAGAELLPMLGVKAQFGRLIQTSDDLPQAAPVVVLSQELWQRRYAGDPNIVGKIVQLDGIAHEVVGVLPPSPGAPLKPAAWTPLQRALSNFVEERGVHTLTTIGRLRTGVSAAQAQQEMDAIAARLDAQYPNDNVGRGARVEDMHDYAVRDLRQPLLLLGGVFALLLLIAAVNVASLLLARASTRRQELAVRSAIGAGRPRIVSQLATEGALLGALGGCCGLLLTQLALVAFRAYGPADILDGSVLHVDASVVLFGVVLSVLLGTIASTLPSLSLLRAGALESLRGGGMRQSQSGSGTRRALVGVQLALAMSLALASGLLLRSFWQMTQIQTGLVSEQTLALSFSLPQAKYPMPAQTEYPRWPAAIQFYERLLEQVRGIDGVSSAAIGHARPLRSNWTTRVKRVDSTDPSADKDEWEMRPVSPGYFSTLGVPLLLGRDVSATDRLEGPAVLLINSAAARRYFPGENPVGKQVLLWSKPREIIGVVGDVRSLSPNAAAAPSMFPPLTQTPFGDITLVVKTRNDPLALLPALRSAIWRVQPDLALFNISTLDQEVQTALGGARFGTGIVAAFALLALALSAIGVFGIVALEVGQRSAEIGLRLALGAQTRHVLRLAMARTLGVVAIGALAGTALVLFAGRLLQGILYGVSANDPVTLVASIAVLFLVAVAASAIPARRALRIDPMVALRRE
jgi:putative ABC transport system permease protein